MMLFLRVKLDMMLGSLENLNQKQLLGGMCVCACVGGEVDW